MSRTKLVWAAMAVIGFATACDFGSRPPTASGSRMAEPTFKGGPARHVLRIMRSSPMERDSMPFELAKNPSEGLPVMRWLLEQGDVEVAVSAARALAMLGTNARVAIPQLALLAETSPPPHRRELFVAIGAISDGSREELDSVVTALASTDVDTVHDALAAATALAWDSALIAEDVAPLLDHPDELVRTEAGHALSYSGSHADRVVAELAPGIRRGDTATLFALGRLGPQAASVARDVKLQLKQQQGGWVMVEVAGLIGDESLQPQLRSRMQTRPVDTATALARLGDRSDEVRQVLEGALDGGGAKDSVRSNHNRINAAAGLYLLEGPGRAVPALIEVLPHAPRRAAIELGRIGPHAAAALPTLTVLATDPRRGGKREVRWAIRQIRDQ